MRVWGTGFPAADGSYNRAELLSPQPVFQDWWHPHPVPQGVYPKEMHGFSCLKKKKKSSTPRGVCCLIASLSAFRARWLPSHYADWNLWGVFICRKQLGAEGE